MKIRYYLLFLLSVFLIPSCELVEDLIENEDVRDNITGSWKVDEDSEIFKKKSTMRFYDVEITKDPADSTLIYIENFYELEGKKIQVVMNDLSLDIPDQTVNSYIIEDGYGSVAYDFESITLYYSVDLGIGEKDIVRADYTRE